MPTTADANIGSYIGVPLVLSDGQVYGTLCAIDPEPHQFTSDEVNLLVVLARAVASWIERDRLLDEQARLRAAAEGSAAETRRALDALQGQHRAAEQAHSDTQAILEAASDGIVLLSSDGIVRSANRRFCELFGYEPDEVCGHHFLEFKPRI